MAVAALLFAAPKASASDQTDLVAAASRTIDNMQSDPAFGPARNMMDRARAMMIVPSLIKGGFIFGAEGGNGVLLARTGRGWSAPAFYSLGSASFGLQIGLEKAQIVMLIMSDRALKAIQDGDVKLGAGGGLTVVTLSAGAEGATASNLSGDIVIWTSATGAYGGLTLNGSVIQARREWNEAYYGRPIPVGDILAGQVRNPPPDGLRQKLGALR
jgi:lipid-binding SYLF domain-containing protein